MLDFLPKKVYLRKFVQKKSAAEARRILAETYGNHILL